ncbi:MAG TPA: hypothetical protein HA254_01460 [Candidatus Diapherotrites archaeon]|uniref:Uncharacterized protein n=1 Tax=Candidatus Iainarchaeum sp. TaxID=3101447 RepID=A0A7J4J264_9ARCH|nr:hypothetical protein [Candidatus Diapherotrites archaeon]
MVKRLFRVFAVAFCILLAASVAFADVSMTYPFRQDVQSGTSVAAGSVEPGQAFDLTFSDNSNYGFEWDKIVVSRAALPAGWEVVSTQVTDTSLVAAIKVPAWAQSNIYVVNLGFSNKDNPEKTDSVDVKITVKRSLVDASFARKSNDAFFYTGGKALYHVSVSNSSIAPQTVRVSSTLPDAWFSDRSITIKPGSVGELDLEVTPQASGVIPFSFRVYEGSDNLIIDSFSSELNVKPTMKGKLSSSLSGFPFFTFSLLPFQLFNSFLSFAF